MFNSVVITFEVTEGHQHLRGILGNSTCTEVQSPAATRCSKESLMAGGQGGAWTTEATTAEMHGLKKPRTK